jgi:hypothetical protein
VTLFQPLLKKIHSQRHPVLSYFHLVDSWVGCGILFSFD